MWTYNTIASHNWSVTGEVISIARWSQITIRYMAKFFLFFIIIIVVNFIKKKKKVFWIFNLKSLFSATMSKDISFD